MATLNLLTYKVKYSDHLVTMHHSAGKSCVLAFMWMRPDTHHTPIHCRSQRSTPMAVTPTAGQGVLSHYQNYSGMAQISWQKVQCVSPESKFPRSQSCRPSVRFPETIQIIGCLTMDQTWLGCSAYSGQILWVLGKVGCPWVGLVPGCPTEAW